MDTIRCKNNFGEYEEVSIEKFIFRPSVYAIIFDKGRIVTLNTLSTGKLFFPGGGVDIGERLEDALKREVKEETGLEIEIDKLLFFKENFFYYKPTDEAYHAFVFFYLCTPITTQLLSDEQVDDLECEKPRWTKIEDIKKDDIHDLSDDIYKELKDLIS